MDRFGLLSEAIRQAPTCDSLAAVARAVNTAVGEDLPMSTWRGIWKSNPQSAKEIRDTIQAAKSGGEPQTITVRGDNTIAVVSDTHSPHHDKAAIDKACEEIARLSPDIIVFNGDIFDFYSLSRFDKDPNRVLGLQDEIDMGAEEVLAPISESSPRSRKIFLPGNHEDRLRKYLWKHPEISSLRAMAMPSLLGLDKLGIEYATKSVEVNGSVLITHGTAVRKWSGSSVRAELEKQRFGISVVMGHVHRAGKFSTWTRNGPVWGIEGGCLCSLEPEYIDTPDWSHAMTVVESSQDGSVGNYIEL